MAGERPRGDRPRRSDVERELDRQDLGWGEFWQLQLFTVPLVLLLTGAGWWVLDHQQGAVHVAVRAAMTTAAAFGGSFLAHGWKRRTARRVLSSGVAPTPPQGVPSSAAGRRSRAVRGFLLEPPLRGIERRLVLQDLLRAGAAVTAVAVPAVALALSDVLPDGAAHEVVRLVAICAVPLAVTALLSAAVVFLRGRR